MKFKRPSWLAISYYCLGASLALAVANAFITDALASTWLTVAQLAPIVPQLYACYMVWKEARDGRY